MPSIMRKSVAGLLIVLFITILATGCMEKEPAVLPTADNGKLDLTDWDWSRDQMLPLDGRWSFEWVSGFKDGHPDPKTFMEVPSLWGHTQSADGRSFPDQGAAVYRLTVFHRGLAELMAIRVPNISTAYEMFLDGKPVMKRGRFGPEARQTAPYQTPGIVYFTDTDDRTEIELRVANFDHRRGGIRTEMIMGTAVQIDRLKTRHVSQELIVIGCFVMIGLYHVGLFVLRRKETGNLFFAMLCLFVALRTGLIGEGFVVQWFPAFNWEWATKLEYIALVLGAWSGFAYYQKMYSAEIRRSWSAAAGVCAFVLTAAALLFPPIRFTSWISYYQAYLLTLCIVAIAALFLSWIRRREGARLALIGVAGLVAAVVNDILFYNGWWVSIDLVPFGLLFLIMMNSFIIAMRSSRTFQRAEQLSSELKMWNERLEEKIAERTEELRKSYITLEEAKTGLERMELSRRQLVSNISHDLRTPITLLQGYLEALRDGVISEEQQRNSTIRLMLGKVEGLNGLIHDLFELSVLEAGRVDLALESITLAEWKDKLTEQYAMDMEEKNIVYRCALGSDKDADVEVFIDVRRMDRVFENLLFNAVRYTPSAGTIRIVLRCMEDRRFVEITVEDSGSGIHPDDLPYIFDRFYKKDKSRHSSSGGSGLGLAISREIVELHAGTIEAYNRPEGGGGFRIVLPVTPLPLT